MKIFSSKKRVAVIGAITAVTLVGGGTAFAYWTASGTGGGAATVGSNAVWTVTQVGTAAGAMSPGVGTSTVTFSAKNTGSGIQRLTPDEVVAAIDDSSGNITDSAGAVAGCLAEWFVPVVGTVPETDVAVNGSVSIPVDVTMTNPDANQDKCKGKSPKLTLSITVAP